MVQQIKNKISNNSRKRGPIKKDCKSKTEFMNHFPNDLQEYVENSLNTIYRGRFDKLNERIDNVLTSISNIDRKVDDMQQEMTTS